MKKLKPLFGFECELDNEGIVSIELDCDYPNTNNCLKFYKSLEGLKIDESKVEFPLRLIHWVVTINPVDKFTIMNYLNIDGIKKIIEENKSKLIGKTTFVKPEIQYPKKTKYPNLHIHFYQVSEDEGMEVVSREDMIESCLIHYENTKQFTTKRLSDLESYVNTLELKIMPFLPMEMVKFDKEGHIQLFETHSLALKATELPF
jgi:hypothetical protein